MHSALERTAWGVQGKHLGCWEIPRETQSSAKECCFSARTVLPAPRYLAKSGDVLVVTIGGVGGKLASSGKRPEGFF